jgi:NTP pyrophosphatase (non-canonical NTP hydrolase)
MSLGDRKKIDTKQIELTLDQLRHRIYYRLKQYGNHSFASKHEILGLVTEEYHELVDAVKTERDEYLPEVRNELLDIAVACIFGVTCIDHKGLDW